MVLLPWFIRPMINCLATCGHVILAWILIDRPLIDPLLAQATLSCIPISFNQTNTFVLLSFESIGTNSGFFCSL